MIVNLTTSASGASSGHYGGDDDPNDIGLIPDDPAAWNVYYQTLAGDGAVLTTWYWNPDYMTWR